MLIYGGDKVKKRKITIILATVAALSILFFVISRVYKALNSPDNRLAPTMVGTDMYVYQDYASSYNHYRVKAQIASEVQSVLVHDMDENSTESYAGTSCIKCVIDVEDSSWGGWLFTYGYNNNGSQYTLNWGEYPNCGFDLSGATHLSFAAKGAQGGEKVEFFVGGLGWDPNSGRITEKYPDSTPKISLGVVELTDEYTVFTIPLERADLSYISGGFGFVVSGNYNDGSVQFYIDEIRYHFPAEGSLPQTEGKTGLSSGEIISLVTAASAIVVAVLNNTGKIVTAKRSAQRKKSEDVSED